MYTVTAMKDVEVAVSGVTRIAVKLNLAQQSQLVEVSASTVTLETASSTLAGIVGPRTVQDLLPAPILTATVDPT